MFDEFRNRKIFGVLIGEILAFVGFYLFFAMFYYVTLWLNRGGFKDPNDGFMNPKSFFNDVGIDYVLKFAFTLPIWYLIFRLFRHWSLVRRMLLHVILLPTFVIVWQLSYYWICDFIGKFHLEGQGKVWDIYIPALFYVLQFGILHTYSYYKENQAKIILEGELRNAALKSELSALKAQLNPHFLYNTFNAISASVPAENEKTRHLIAQLADLFRYQLKASKNELVSLKDELDFVRKYLDLEKERFQERLEYIITANEDIMDVSIPSMILQPLIENAVKYAIAPSLDGGKIEINIFKMGDKLKFEIIDSGKGIMNKDTIFDKGIGLTNTKLRLEKMYQSHLEFGDNLPAGLKVSFEI